MKKIIVLLLASFLIYNSGKAQDYNNAIGIKFYPTGITFKHFLSDNKAIEGIGYFYKYGTRITGLYEIYNPIEALDGLQWYYGFGAHVGFIDSKYGGSTALGLDGVIGLDYKVAELPIDLSLDFQPSLELGSFYGDNRLQGWGGLGIRFTF